MSEAHTWYRVLSLCCSIIVAMSADFSMSRINLAMAISLCSFGRDQPSGACPRTEPLVAASAAYKGYSKSSPALLQVAGVPGLCHHWPPRPRFCPPLPGSGQQSTLINFRSIRIKINKEKSRKYQASRLNQGKIKGKSREIQDKSSRLSAISGNLTKFH
jgi:hypothetical protein